MPQRHIILLHNSAVSLEKRLLIKFILTEGYIPAEISTEDACMHGHPKALASKHYIQQQQKIDDI
jgi:hypothetical protein